MLSPWTHKMDSPHAHKSSSFPSLFDIRLMSHRGQLLLSSCLSFFILTIYITWHSGHFTLFDVENMASKTDPPQPATLDSVMALVQEQLKAAAAREAQLTKMLEKVMDGSEASLARLA